MLRDALTVVPRRSRPPRGYAPGIAELPPTGTGPGHRRATVALAAALALAAAVLAACGDEPADEFPDQGVTTTTVPAATSTTSAARTYSADLTTTDGYRYKITVLVGARSATGTADACPGPATAGRAYVPVTLTVANAATDRVAPFPPLRVELTTDAGSNQVLVRDSAGPCTFTPRAPSLGPGASAVFQGTSPAIEDTVRGAAAGQIEVKVSENTFSLAAPLP